jgi:hypothetical protein
VKGETKSKTNSDGVGGENEKQNKKRGDEGRKRKAKETGGVGVRDIYKTEKQTNARS